MSKDLNRCEFIGRLGADPETRYLQNGNAVTSITLAVGDDYKDKNTGEKVEQTEWVRCSAFGKLAEIMAEYLKKGSKVYIAGKFKTSSYEKEGVKHYSTQINVGEMLMLDSRSTSADGGAEQRPTGNGAGGHRAEETAPDMDSFDDDIPF